MGEGHAGPGAVAGARAALGAWRAAHPQATFGEMEEAVEAQLHQVRAALLAELAAAVPVPRPAACPRCGGALRGKGEHARTVVLPGDATVALRREYLHCPACGTGLFPPG
jgi:hypothetical protein